MNYACDFSQSETEKYFEWIINCNNYYFVTTVKPVSGPHLLSYGWSHLSLDPNNF